MLKFFKYILLGIFFGIVLSKSEVISWYRIYEMFRFESFHMFGIIGSAVVIGAIIVQLIKKSNLKSTTGSPIKFTPKNMSIPRYLIGGTFFGLGWALVGACPGPLFILLGRGVLSISIVLFGAILGTFIYGLFRDKLPH